MPSLTTSALMPPTRAEKTDPRPFSTLPDDNSTVDDPAFEIAESAASSTELATGQAKPRLVGAHPFTRGVGSAAGNVLGAGADEGLGDGLGSVSPLGAGGEIGTTARSAASRS